MKNVSLWKSLYVFFMAVPNILLSGFTISKLWLWFVVPLGMPVIGMAHGLGIATLAAMLTFHPIYYDMKTKEAIFSSIARTSTILALLLFGYIYSLFM